MYILIGNAFPSNVILVKMNVLTLKQCISDLQYIINYAAITKHKKMIQQMYETNLDHQDWDKAKSTCLICKLST